MNKGAIICLLTAGAFLILAIVFAILKEKGAILISGFNTLPKEEREKYYKLKMSKDIRNTFFRWFALFAVGGILCYFLSTYFAIASFLVWLVLLFKEVHIDTEKAFGKYKL